MPFGVRTFGLYHLIFFHILWPITRCLFLDNSIFGEQRNGNQHLRKWVGLSEELNNDAKMALKW